MVHARSHNKRLCYRVRSAHVTDGADGDVCVRVAAERAVVLVVLHNVLDPVGQNLHQIVGVQLDGTVKRRTQTVRGRQVRREVRRSQGLWSVEDPHRQVGAVGRGNSKRYRGTLRALFRSEEIVGTGFHLSRSTYLPSSLVELRR